MAGSLGARDQKPTRLGRSVRTSGNRARHMRRRQEPHAQQTNWLRDVILGGQDGLVNILGIILGVVAGHGSRTVLLTTGLAAAITESISMGAVAYTSSVSERDYYQAQEAQEQREVEEVPEEEEQEVREIYAAKGFSGQLLDDVVHTIVSNREVWINTMMDEELHLEPVEMPRIWRGAIVVTIATLIGHLLPLWPFFFFNRVPGLIAALVISALVLFGVGAYSAITLVGDWRKEGIKMLCIGLGAAGIGYAISRLFGAGGF
jgi:VIT1/CCC1 family predicted Fe2+/Mn2+ transporter